MRLKALLILTLLVLVILCFHKQNMLSNIANAQVDDPQKQENNLPKNFKGEHLWDAKVKTGKMIVVGDSKRGQRRVIPITGGTFEGPNIKGEILPGGEDWQLVRPDGDTELYARYLLKTSDGHIIQVINQAQFYKDGKGKVTRTAQSVLDFEAPNNSPYAYLNHGIFLGTLGFPKLNPGEDSYVIIGVYMVQ
jgi:hypothetical protein